ncbi:uncharacterized protein A4U43_C02F7780 [Asparagus officinalis]|uniref:Uncharacterized protein n=1 Tax=Asparagus officinalis TaxID=4686 RepID=A0A5P1FIM1_ASPOF|nr:uncharacterized protein LOC109830391 [Asparagus officinalis]XP_020253233.1 uncharacterized protein LOC109830391 [Asparagus officinalis]ONK77553.1 uncharacterized protein A4U43_C02F7780 [Asparagus officinalis]
MIMSRPMVLVFLLMILIITSQFEWKQQLVNDMDPNPSIAQKQQQNLRREEVVKEKIILSQEKNIQKLHELVQSLQQQLLQCREINNTVSIPGNSLNENERQKILED